MYTENNRYKANDTQQPNRGIWRMDKTFADSYDTIVNAYCMISTATAEELWLEDLPLQIEHETETDS